MDKKTNSMYVRNMIGALLLMCYCIISGLFSIAVITGTVFLASLFVKTLYKNRR